MTTKYLQQQVANWLEGQYDLDTKAEIQRLQREDSKALFDAFYTDLTFGTAGLRGVMGAGPNRMNTYTIRRASQGLARYLNKEKVKGPILIAYDSRHNSRKFAEEAAKVFAANERETLLFKEICPVPLASFGCRLHLCVAAVVITASHNPPEYNGYKVYWSHGGQILPPHDRGIIEEVERIKALDKIRTVPLDHPLIHEIDGETDAAYFEAITPLQTCLKQNQASGKELKIVYTSLHGTGIKLMPEALKRWGFENVHLVSDQCIPDGDFPTTKSPNPEEKEALEGGLQELKKVGGDLLIATDPDADRLGVALLIEEEPILFTGNQIASLCLYHILESTTKTKALPKTATFIKTIVTTELFRAIGESYGHKVIDLLPGFKYIGEMMEKWAKGPPESPTFGFGAEESHGYLFGTYARDKDGIISGCLIAEAALAAKKRGQTLYDVLLSLYQRYGIYRESVRSLTYKGKAGHEEMEAMMDHLRKDPPDQLDGIPLLAIEDYLQGERIDISNGQKRPLPLPQSNALLFWLEDGTKLVVRPSGTEPKIKIYCGIIWSRFDALQEGIKKADDRMAQYLDFLEEKLR